MQRIPNDPVDIAEYLRGRGVQQADIAGYMLEDRTLDATHQWAEPLLVSCAMDVLKELEHTEDYELLALHTNWEGLRSDALNEGDELAASVCLDHTSDKAPKRYRDGAWSKRLRAFFQ